ncbi:50S ribosomal protein L11 [bacterium]|nr:50S ribosomal protein L11 [bacterium]
MAKPVKTVIKVQIEGAQAKPAPPLGPALGQHGVAIMDFCREFNAQTQDKAGEILPTVITIYEDRSFDFQVKTPPAATLLMRAAGMSQGSSYPQRLKVAKVTWEQCREIAQAKLVDLNTDDVEQGAHIIAGTARSMGYIVEGHPTGRDDHFSICTKAELDKMQQEVKRSSTAG